MIHRYLAGILGLFVIAVFIQAWREKAQIRVSPWLPTALVVIVGFQAMLGMWTVTMLLKPAIVTMHLMGGMSTLAILTWITHRHWGVSSAGFLTNARTRFLRVLLLLFYSCKYFWVAGQVPTMQHWHVQIFLPVMVFGCQRWILRTHSIGLES